MREDQVAEVDVGLPVGQRVRADPVEGQHQLQLDAVLAQRGEAELAGVADEDDPAGDADLLAGLGAGLEFRVLGADLGQRVGPRDADRERRAVRVGRISRSYLARRTRICSGRSSLPSPSPGRSPARPYRERVVPDRAGRRGRVAAMTTEPRPGRARHALRGLTKSFKSPQGPVHAVRGIDIDIAPGETVALLGPNGAGKSTTIDMLLGLLPPDAGSMTLFGMAPATRSAPARSARCCRSAGCPGPHGAGTARDGCEPLP